MADIYFPKNAWRKIGDLNHTFNWAMWRCEEFARASGYGVDRSGRLAIARCELLGVPTYFLMNGYRHKFYGDCPPECARFEEYFGRTQRCERP